MLWLTAMGSLAEAAAQLGDAATAPALYAELEPYADRLVQWSFTGNAGSVQRLLGRTAAVAGRRDRARAHFEAALARHAALGAAPLLARTRCDYGEFLAQAPADAARAELLRDAGVAARRLGMAGVAARCAVTGRRPAELPSHAYASARSNRADRGSSRPRRRVWGGPLVERPAPGGPSERDVVRIGRVGDGGHGLARLSAARLGSVFEVDGVQLERDPVVAGVGDVLARFEAAGEADGLALVMAVPWFGHENPLFPAGFREPSAGLEPATPSLPWQSG